jgi:hypothetical protein
MVIILIVAARDVGLLASQWAALIVATILLAGLCVWIIHWDGEDGEVADEIETAQADTALSESADEDGDGPAEAHEATSQ